MSNITIENIPPLPNVALRVMQFDPGHPDSDIQGLETIIKPDKGITAEMLKIANSALYGRSGRIRTLRDSITLLGLKTAKNLVVMLATKNINTELRGAVYRRYIQEYPVVCALVALDLCTPLGLKPLKEEAFLGGLLHKIGMTIIALNKPDHYSTLLKYAEKERKNLIELENESYKTNHIKVGLMVFQTWKLPVDLQEVVSEHRLQQGHPRDKSDLVRIIALADILTRQLMGIPLETGEKDHIQGIAACYNLPEAKIAAFDDRYFQLLKEHPFYQQVAGS